MMKTSLTEIPMCPRERSTSYKTLSRLVPCYKREWATLLHLCYYCYLLLATNHLTTQLSVTDNFSACREYLAGFFLLLVGFYTLSLHDALPISLLHHCYFSYLLLVANHLTTQLSVTDNFSACREYLAENRLSFPSAPHWVRHSYLSKGLR